MKCGRAIIAVLSVLTRRRKKLKSLDSEIVAKARPTSSHSLHLAVELLDSYNCSSRLAPACSNLDIVGELSMRHT